MFMIVVKVLLVIHRGRAELDAGREGARARGREGAGSDRLMLLYKHCVL